jgi:hypothetical protein
MGLALALAAGFGAVVQQGVRRGDAAKRELALRQEAAWRCKALRTRVLQADCQRRYLEQPPQDSAGLQAMVAEIGAP